jgi:acetyl-CoA synthetase
VRGAFRAAGERSDVPVLLAATLPELLPDGPAAELAAAGVATVAGLPAAVACAAALAAPPPDPERIREIAAAARAAAGPPAGATWLAEHEAKALLAGAGLPVVAGRLVADADEAVAAFAELGGPIALKRSARGLTHKSAAGALRLDLADAAAVRTGAGALANGSGALLAERMAPPGAELFVAARADTVVPVLAVGLGGVWTEALDDVALVPLPAAPERVERALRSLRGAPALRDADLPAAARIASAVGDLLLERRLGLLECNPVIVHPTGATIVDALATTGATA